MRMLLTALLLLTSCEMSKLRTEVRRTHSLPSKGAGQTFSIRNLTKCGELERDIYSSKVAQNLIKYGWTQSGGTPDYRVNFLATMGVSVPIEIETPIIRQTGGGTSYHSGNYSGALSSGSFSGTSYTAPTYGMVGTTTHTEVLHQRLIFFSITDKRGKTVVFSDAESRGNSPDLLTVVPGMIDAMFDRFPGVNGSVFTVEKRLQ